MKSIFDIIILNKYRYINNMSHNIPMHARIHPCSFACLLACMLARPLVRSHAHTFMTDLIVNKIWFVCREIQYLCSSSCAFFVRRTVSRQIDRSMTKVWKFNKSISFGKLPPPSPPPKTFGSADGYHNSLLVNSKSPYFFVSINRSITRLVS